NGKKKLQPRGGQFWDGRASDLSEQVTGPLLNPVEMNNPSLAAVGAKVTAGPYAELVRAVAGATVFDDDKTAMTALAKA
ncbi:cytochrome c peroxidase, partial [Acinetobacter baumannii]